MQFIIGMYCADTSGAAFKICGKMKKNQFTSINNHNNNLEKILSNHVDTFGYRILLKTATCFKF